VSNVATTSKYAGFCEGGNYNSAYNTFHYDGGDGDSPAEIANTVGIMTRDTSSEMSMGYFSMMRFKYGKDLLPQDVPLLCFGSSYTKSKNSSNFDRPLQHLGVDENELISTIDIKDRLL